MYESSVSKYGLYPYADRSHGAPCDDEYAKDNANRVFATTASLFAFLVSSLYSALTVMYAGAKPYKWILSYPWRE